MVNTKWNLNFNGKSNWNGIDLNYRDYTEFNWIYNGNHNKKSKHFLSTDSIEFSIKPKQIDYVS